VTVGAVQRPLQGLTSDGTVRPGLFPLQPTGVSTAPITDAASHFLGALIDGHHLCLNGTVIGDQFLLPPSFMGSEPCQVFDGPLAGTMVFTAEEQAGLDLIRSLDERQAAQGCSAAVDLSR
jgi:hypothetical protein